jgi:hypothetical protein
MMMEDDKVMPFNLDSPMEEIETSGLKAALISNNCLRMEIEELKE